MHVLIGITLCHAIRCLGPGTRDLCELRLSCSEIWDLKLEKRGGGKEGQPKKETDLCAKIGSPFLVVLY